MQLAQGLVLRAAQAVEVPPMREPYRQVHVLALVPQRNPRPAIGREAGTSFQGATASDSISATAATSGRSRQVATIASAALRNSRYRRISPLFCSAMPAGERARSCSCRSHFSKSLSSQSSSNSRILCFHRLPALISTVVDIMRGQ